jgi:hypothetical protein
MFIIRRSYQGKLFQKSVSCETTSIHSFRSAWGKREMAEFRLRRSPRNLSYSFLNLMAKVFLNILRYFSFYTLHVRNVKSIALITDERIKMPSSIPTEDDDSPYDDVRMFKLVTAH